MSETEPLSGPAFGPSAGGDPRQLVILLHGRGADGNDLLGLAPRFAELLPAARFVAPNAPYRCEPPYAGYEWFHLPDFQSNSILANSFLDGVRATGPLLDAFIDKELAASRLGADSLALVGFSQGTMMSLFVGLRRVDRLACILGYSGKLVGAELLSREITARPPVALIMGDADELIPPQAHPQAIMALESVGVPVEAHLRPGLGHGIDQEGVEIGRRFVARNLGMADRIV